jgi:translocation and assembly module TamA
VISKFLLRFDRWLLLAACPASVWAAVEIEGLEAELEVTVLNTVSLSREICEAPGWRIASQFRRTPREIRSVLEANGYYSSQITSDLAFEPECWEARFEIVPGSPVLLRNVDLRVAGDAAEDADFDRVLDVAGLEAGQQLLHGRYESLKSEMLNLSRRKGYAEARFIENRVDVYPDERSADIVLDFDSGPRYAFGDFIIEQDFLDSDLVGRYLGIEPGTPFDREELAVVYNDLVDSDFFSLVNVQPLAANPETRRIPVLVDLMPGNRLVLSYGGGFSTDTGGRFRFARENRRLNERGAQLGLNTELSPVLSEIVLTYRFPYGDPREEWISFDSGIRREDSDSTRSDALEIGVRRIIKRGGDWSETRFVDFLIEDFEIADTRDRTTLVQPGASWTRVRADNTIRPDRGDRLIFEISTASDQLGSDTNFIQTIFESRWIRSLGERSRFLSRVRAGATWNRDFDELPPSARYFAGGDDSIRGYEFRSQGPVDADGDVIGGDRLLVASVEYEFSLREQWSVATFYDAGNAYRESNFDLVAGFGVGARWQSPLGPIRIDVARPLDGIDRDLRLHISLGPDL